MMDGLVKCCCIVLGYVWLALVFGGTGYVVFWLHRSPGWFLLALLIAWTTGCTYRTEAKAGAGDDAG